MRSIAEKIDDAVMRSWQALCLNVEKYFYLYQKQLLLS